MMRDIPMTPRGSRKASSYNSDQEESYERVEAKAILTAMENRVLTCVTLAKTNKEIAVVLGISPATVKRHIENLLRKLKLRNRVEAAVYGLILGGCPSRDRCALEEWRNSREPDYKNGPIDP